MTGRSFCDFVVWTQKELHIERLTLDEALLKSALPTAKTFFKICILPELLGKWYTRQHSTTEKDDSLQCEDDDGSWCHRKERKGGDMVACDSRSCTTKWFHFECVGLCTVRLGKWHCARCEVKHSQEQKTKSEYIVSNDVLMYYREQYC